MLKIASSSPEPYWFDLIPGVRLQVRPITIATMLIARREVGKVVAGEDQADVDERASVALVRQLAQRGIVAWEGVGDADGEPLPVSEVNVDALLEVWEAYTAFEAKYVSPALVREAEKNGSSSSRSGTSEEEPTTATPAA